MTGLGNGVGDKGQEGVAMTPKFKDSRTERKEVPFSEESRESRGEAGLELKGLKMTRHT